MGRPADKQRAIEQARVARVRLGVGLDAPVPDILRLIEDVAEIPVTVLDLPEGVAGAIGHKKGRHFIFINSADQPVRRRFTLAHEFGHHELGHEPVVDRREDIYEGSGKRRPEEVEANYFASEFLAPEQAVRLFAQARRIETVDLDAVVRLADFFGVSAQAARIRFEQVGLLPKKRDRDRLDGQIKAEEHVPLIRAASLDGPTDSLSREKIDFRERRIPESAFRRMAHAYSRGLARVDRLASQVGTTSSELERQLAAAGVEAPRLEDDDKD